MTMVDGMFVLQALVEDTLVQTVSTHELSMTPTSLGISMLWPDTACTRGYSGTCTFLIGRISAENVFSAAPEATPRGVEGQA